jgi:hypothetical protein
MAESKTLIKIEGDKPTAGLATSWKKVSDGKYEFSLDTKAKVDEEKLSADMVKKSVEKKLGDKGVKVAAKGANAVIISYSGTDDDFLKLIAKAKIRSGKDVEIALESGVSEGGIRAKTAERAPAVDEVKGTVVSFKNGIIEVRVVAVGGQGSSGQIKEGTKVKVATTGTAQIKSGEVVFFKPTGNANGVWQATAVTKD